MRFFSAMNMTAEARTQFANTSDGNVCHIRPQRHALVMTIAGVPTALCIIAVAMGLASIGQAYTMYPMWSAVFVMPALFSGFWLMVGIIPLFVFGWQIAGEEEISVTSSTAIQTKKLGPLRMRRQFRLENVSNASVAIDSLGYYCGMSGLCGGTVHFDYLGRRYAVGHGINETDGQILQQLIASHP